MTDPKFVVQGPDAKYTVADVDLTKIREGRPLLVPTKDTIDARTVQFYGLPTGGEFSVPEVDLQSGSEQDSARAIGVLEDFIAVVVRGAKSLGADYILSRLNPVAHGWGQPVTGVEYSFQTLISRERPTE